MQKTKPKSLIEQEIKLKCTYGLLIESCAITRSKLTCEIWLQPSSESIKYKIRIIFKLGYYPQAYLLEPNELALYGGKLPHHIYDKNYPVRLCVFYPRQHEWNDQMFLADAFIPWVCTWLNAYEYWQITGQWFYAESKDTRPKE